MTKYVINGGKRLNGEVTISGAKNAAVAIVPAALLVDGPCRIENVPKIIDVTLQLEILRELGVSVRLANATTVELDGAVHEGAKVPYELMRKIRASYYLIGALLGKYHHAEVAMPGGCNFGGIRPIDQHIKGFEALGANISIREGGYIHADAPNGLTGAHIYFDVVSVGATINIMLAAVLAKGMTVIENAAKEPHIVDLANFLNAMGADVKGAGTDVTINIMLAAVLAKGMTVIENAAKEPHIVDLANFLNAMGADVKGAGTDVIKIRGVRKCSQGAAYCRSGEFPQCHGRGCQGRRHGCY